jgi:hypothetical protein
MIVDVHRSASGILEDDALDDVGDVFTAIGRRLEVLVHLFPLDDFNRVFFFLEQPREGAAQERVRFVFRLFRGICGRKMRSRGSKFTPHQRCATGQTAGGVMLATDGRAVVRAARPLRAGA